MPLNTINNSNLSKGVQEIFVYTADASPIFIPMLLFSLYVIVTMGSFFSRQRTGKDENITISMAIGSFITFGAMLILSLVPNLVNPFTQAVTFSVMVVSILFLYYGNREK